MRRTINLAVAMFALTIGAAAAETATNYGFLTHAAFFSLAAKQPNLLDPHAFVPGVAAQAGIGPQGIGHLAGYRPAYGVDDPGTPISNALGQRLALALGQWFGARGTVSGLIPRGRYSLFENHFGVPGVTFTPLDGTGKTNSFTASRDGAAKLTLLVPGAITHAEEVLLVFHSDGTDHGLQRGEIGVNAHHQLIMRVL